MKVASNIHLFLRIHFVIHVKVQLDSNRLLFYYKHTQTIVFPFIKVYQQLFIFASMALALVHGHPRPHSPRAGASIFKSTETFSRAGVILTAKPECLKIDQEYQHNSSSRV